MNKEISTGLLVVPFVPDLKKLKLVKTTLACLLMSRLESCFERNPDGFYKYVSPNLKRYVSYGLTWTEELKIKEREFREAYKQIGVTYKSHNKYLQAENKFQDKYYCRIQDPLNSNRTLFLRNHKLVDEALKSLIPKRAL